MQGPVSFIKPSFSGGEFSPALWSRVDIEKYRYGARRLRNFTVQPEGGISNRPGFKMIAPAKYDDKDARLLEFAFSTTQQYAIETGDEYFRFFTDEGQVNVNSASAWMTTTPYVVGDYVTESATIYYCIEAHTSGTFATDLAADKWVAQTIYEIPSPYGEDDIWNIRYAQSADVVFMANGSVKPKMLTRLADTNWTVQDYDFLEGPFMLDNTSTVTLTAGAVSGTGVTITASSATFQSGHVGSLWKMRHYIGGQTSTAAITTTGTQTGIKCGGTWRIITHGTWTGTIAVEKSTDGGSNWTTIRKFSSVNDNNVSTFGEDSNDGEPYLVRLNATAWSSGTANVDLTTDPFFQVGFFKITGFTNTTTVTATITKELGSTSATDDWAEGAWSDVRGWPEEVVFFGDRLVWARGYEIWMSESGNYYRFRRSSPLLDTDGITVPIPSRQLNEINGLIPLLDLIALTSSGEWTVTSNGAALTPTTVTQKPNGFTGSNGVNPLVIGNRAIFIEASGSQVHDLGFSLADDGFTGSVLSIFSKHLFAKYQIVDMAFQKAPDGIAWMIRDDGTMLSLTYLREQEVLAWTWHDTVGSFRSVVSLQASGFNQLYAIVERENGKYIETMQERMASDEPEDQFFVDSGLLYYDPKTIVSITKANPGIMTINNHGYSNGDLVDLRDFVGMSELIDNYGRVKVANKTTHTFELTDPDNDANINTTSYETFVSGVGAKAVTVITGLDHLEDEEVSVLGDGNVDFNYDEPATVSSGSITLPSPRSKVLVGLPYLSDLETLSIDFSSDAGTIQGKRMRVTKVVLQMLRSRGGFIGPTFSTDGPAKMKELANTFPEFYDEASPLYTGDIYATLVGGWDTGGRICVQQRDPLPMQILSIIPTVTVGGTSLSQVAQSATV